MSDETPAVVRTERHGLLVLTLAGDAVAAITWFTDTGVFRHLGLPRMLRA